jgi:putative transcription factor
VARVIQQGRQAKGLSQKDLATKINEKQQIVNDYEAGRYVLQYFEMVSSSWSSTTVLFNCRGIPNNVILGKMERTLGIKLRGKEIGQPFAPPSAKK